MILLPFRVAAIYPDNCLQKGSNVKFCMTNRKVAQFSVTEVNRGNLFEEISWKFESFGKYKFS